ncbi:hypothetical protein ACFSHR_17480 [Azotobacter chroococcum]
MAPALAAHGTPGVFFATVGRIFSGDFRASTGAIRTAAGLIVPISAFILMNRFTYGEIQRKTLKQ